MGQKHESKHLFPCSADGKGSDPSEQAEVRQSGSVAYRGFQLGLSHPGWGGLKGKPHGSWGCLC